MVGCLCKQHFEKRAGKNVTKSSERRARQVGLGGCGKYRSSEEDAEHVTVLLSNATGEAPRHQLPFEPRPLPPPPLLLYSKLSQRDAQRDQRREREAWGGVKSNCACAKKGEK